MLFATAGQGALFLWMMSCGVILGFLYLLFSALRRFIQAGFWLSLLCDLALGVICAAVWLLFLLSGNYGRVRLFEILATLLGALLFAFAAAPAAKRLDNCLRRSAREITTRFTRNRLIKVIFK